MFRESESGRKEMGVVHIVELEDVRAIPSSPLNEMRREIRLWRDAAR